MKPISVLEKLSLLMAVSVLVSVCFALYDSLHWPLVGDASLMHYVVFLLSKGAKPYHDIIDINLPGSYLFEATAMRLFGWGALGWRLYDLALILLLGAASFLIASRFLNAKSEIRVTTALTTALLFLIHAQDGLAQLGQRDLLIAALILFAYAALFAAQTGLRNKIFLSSLAVGLTLAIKPTFLPLGLLLLALSARQMRRTGLSLPRHILYGLTGLLLPSAAIAAWLAHTGSLSAFWTQALPLINLHASLGRRSLGYLLSHATSPITAVCVLWLITLAVTRPRLTLQRLQLLTGIAIALLGYVLQGKGYPYQRYPLLALFLLAINLDLFIAIRRAGVGRLAALTAIALQCLYLAPHAAWQIHSFRPATPVELALAADLTAIPNLDGQVQCLDTFGGCINTLYNLRLTQGTGFLYDCYLFPPQPNPTSTRYRESFWAAFTSARPRVLVVSEQFCFGEHTFAKLDRWPQLRDTIAQQYTLQTEWSTTQPQRWWSRDEVPPRFRIYLRNEDAPTP
jgi:hypothetical protein